MLHQTSYRRLVVLLAGLALGAASLAARPNTATPLDYRGETVVRYRAWFQDEHLVVEVEHQAPWHTYAMDNVERARRRSGKKNPDTELPTIITLSGALQPRGEWRQSPPAELSQPELQWFTWGFEGVSHFALPIEANQAEAARIVVNGQACTAEVCAMIDDLIVEVTSAPADEDGHADLDSLIELASATGEVSP